MAQFAKDTLGCAFFSFSTAIDWKADGLEVVAWVDNLDAGLSVQLRTKLGRRQHGVSVARAGLRRRQLDGARESTTCSACGSRGIRISRRILLADDWEGHPLLKSYAVDTPHPPYR